jgi:hypothetical protein
MTYYVLIVGDHRLGMEDAAEAVRFQALGS